MNKLARKRQLKNRDHFFQVKLQKNLANLLHVIKSRFMSNTERGIITSRKPFGLGSSNKLQLSAIGNQCNRSVSRDTRQN